MSVEIGRTLYEIDPDFRTIMEVEKIIFDPDITEEQELFAREMMQYSDMSYDDACMNARYYDALDLFYKGNIPEDLDVAMEKLLWFYSCGREEKRGKRLKKPVVSFEFDFDYINAGFIQDYKIDLFDIEFLHWWNFMSLFSALQDDCKICEIMGWRGADMKKLDKEQRKRVREMQKIYALPEEDVSREERERQDKITAALLNGGDLTGIL